MLPAIPLRDVKLTIKFPAVPARVRRVSDGGEHPFEFRDGELTIALKRLEHIELFEIEVKHV